jgi:hypothetical protein
VGRYAHEFQRKGQLILRPEYFGCLSRILIYRKPQKDKTQPCGCQKEQRQPCGCLWLCVVINPQIICLRWSWSNAA